MFPECEKSVAANIMSTIQEHYMDALGSDEDKGATDLPTVYRVVKQKSSLGFIQIGIGKVNYLKHSVYHQLSPFRYLIAPLCLYFRVQGLQFYYWGLKQSIPDE